MTMIQNEAAYEAAIARNIRMNAAKTRSRQFLSTPEGRRANDFLLQIGEFDGTDATHPAVKASLGPFYDRMRDSLLQWGGLTDAQTRFTLEMITRGEARVAERAKAREDARNADIERSGWIGQIGERREFTLNIRMVIEMEGHYGISFLHVCADADGNVIVYKGTKKLGERMDRVRVKATVKEHTVRDGVRQTKIARPSY